MNQLSEMLPVNLRNTNEIITISDDATKAVVAVTIKHDTVQSAFLYFAERVCDDWKATSITNFPRKSESKLQLKFISNHVLEIIDGSETIRLIEEEKTKAWFVEINLLQKVEVGKLYLITEGFNNQQGNAALCKVLKANLNEKVLQLEYVHVDSEGSEMENTSTSTIVLKEDIEAKAKELFIEHAMPCFFSHPANFVKTRCDAMKHIVTDMRKWLSERKSTLSVSIMLDNVDEDKQNMDLFITDADGIVIHRFTAV